MDLVSLVRQVRQLLEIFSHFRALLLSNRMHSVHTVLRESSSEIRNIIGNASPEIRETSGIWRYMSTRNLQGK